jgi:hypothetical protein
MAILNADSSEAIPGEFLVALCREDLDEPELTQVVSDLCSRHGGEVANIYSGFRMFFLRSTDEEAQAYAADPQIKFVERNQWCYPANVT